MRHMGQEVVIHGRDARMHRGIMDGFDPPRRGTETIRGMEGPHRKYLPYMSILLNICCFLDLSNE
jgi:hypothetical protein